MSDTDPSPEQEAPPALTPAQQTFHHQAVALATGSALTPGVNVRQFTLHNSSSILAFLVKELPDSFLVVLPSYLKATPDGQISAHLVTAAALCRFMKSNILLTSMAEGLPLLYYLDSILPQIKKHPGYFDTTRTTRIKDVQKALKAELGVELIEDISKALTKGTKPTSVSFSEVSEEDEIEALLQRSTPLSSRQRH